ncbi:hypothetical protein [Haloarcula pellucida]|uniref:Major facilitator superfamily (MFS) profile domain-containing protein n=1 Tax=Haloarcula pellucida TaxID=1427151 RepID=A0A830GKD7_9EURY|nr:hypothetical protein [Halomicroarcula pellucida]MBX0348846.1 hypothetical protein [Halomicroarcula pellucida]GGN91561.1 hypothetical protein GCM10009030_14620 [Halomicroarcula pellucida]
MKTLQTRLLGGHVLALMTLVAADIAGSTPLVTAAFAAAFLTLAALFAAMAGTLVGGVTDRPTSPLATRRPGQ